MLVLGDLLAQVSSDDHSEEGCEVPGGGQCKQALMLWAEGPALGPCDKVSPSPHLVRKPAWHM